MGHPDTFGQGQAAFIMQHVIGGCGGAVTGVAVGDYGWCVLPDVYEAVCAVQFQ